MGQIWDKLQPVLDLAEAAEDALRVLVLCVAPVGVATFAAVAYFARTDHLVAAWLTVGLVGLVGVAIARTAQPRSPRAGRHWGRLSSALYSPAVDKARWFVRDTTIVLTVMWITCLVLLWVLTSTNALALASRLMPVAPTAIDRESLTGGATEQILTMFTVALPALLVVLIAAGALHRPRSVDRKLTTANN